MSSSPFDGHPNLARVFNDAVLSDLESGGHGDHWIVDALTGDFAGAVAFRTEFEKWLICARHCRRFGHFRARLRKPSAWQDWIGTVLELPALYLISRVCALRVSHPPPEPSKRTPDFTIARETEHIGIEVKANTYEQIDFGQPDALDRGRPGPDDAERIYKKLADAADQLTSHACSCIIWCEDPGSVLYRLDANDLMSRLYGSRIVPTPDQSVSLRATPDRSGFFHTQPGNVIAAVARFEMPHYLHIGEPLYTLSVYHNPWLAECCTPIPPEVFDPFPQLVERRGSALHWRNRGWAIRASEIGSP